jgi:hypothetical protein
MGSHSEARLELGRAMRVRTREPGSGSSWIWVKRRNEACDYQRLKGGS